MQTLDEKELMKVNGGGINFGVVASVAAIVAFIVGILDGVVRPLKCR